MVMDVRDLPAQGRFLVDSAPIIYFLEDHAQLAARYAPIFERADSDLVEIVISTVTLAEILTGPLRTGNEKLAEKYRSALLASAGRFVELSPAIAVRAARIRAHSRLRLPDAVQMATALETACTAFVTHDSDFWSPQLEGLHESVAVYC